MEKSVRIGRWSTSPMLVWLFTTPLDTIKRTIKTHSINRIKQNEQTYQQRNKLRLPHTTVPTISNKSFPLTCRKIVRLRSCTGWLTPPRGVHSTRFSLFRIFCCGFVLLFSRFPNSSPSAQPRVLFSIWIMASAINSQTHSTQATTWDGRALLSRRLPILWRALPLEDMRHIFLRFVAIENGLKIEGNKWILFNCFGVTGEAKMPCVWVRECYEGRGKLNDRIFILGEQREESECEEGSVRGRYHYIVNRRRVL